MTEKRFRVHELVKYDYSDIGEYIDENHTDRPLRNDIVVELLNELHEEKQHLQRRCGAMQEEIEILSEENEMLKKDIEYYKTERLALFEYLDKKDDLKLELKVEK